MRQSGIPDAEPDDCTVTLQASEDLCCGRSVVGGTLFGLRGLRKKNVFLDILKEMLKNMDSIAIF